MRRLILPLVMLAGCGPIPVQVSKQDQTQRVAQDVAQAADQQSSHASESRQGTNSMPVIIICNTVSSPGGHCIAPNQDGPIQREINRNFKGATK
jgi:hypothetical protein